MPIRGRAVAPGAQELVGSLAPGGTALGPLKLRISFGASPSTLLQLLGSVPPSADARLPEERFRTQLKVRDFVLCAMLLGRHVLL